MSETLKKRLINYKNESLSHKNKNDLFSFNDIVKKSTYMREDYDFPDDDMYVDYDLSEQQTEEPTSTQPATQPTDEVLPDTTNDEQPIEAAPEQNDDVVGNLDSLTPAPTVGAGLPSLGGELNVPTTSKSSPISPPAVPQPSQPKSVIPTSSEEIIDNRSNDKIEKKLEQVINLNQNQFSEIQEKFTSAIENIDNLFSKLALTLEKIEQKNEKKEEIINSSSFPFINQASKPDQLESEYAFNNLNRKSNLDLNSIAQTLMDI